MRMRVSISGIGLILGLALYGVIHSAVERLPTGLSRLSTQVLLEQLAPEPGSTQTQHVDFLFSADAVPRYVLIVARAQQYGVYWRGETLVQGGQRWQGAPDMQLQALRGGDSGALRAYYLSQPWPLTPGLSIYSGPPESLLKLERQWRVLQRQLPSLSALFGLVIGLLMLALWAQHREQLAYLLVGMLALSWAGLAAGWSGHLPGIWHRLALLGAPLGLALSALGLSLHWQGALRRYRLPVLMTGLASLGLLIWLNSPRLAYLFAAATLAICLLWQIYLVMRGQGPGIWLLAPLVLMALVALQDVHMLAGLGSGEPLLLLALLAPVLLLVLGWWLLADFVDSLRSTQEQNRMLDALVAEKTTQLEAQFAQMRALENQRVLDQERQRLLRDIHDGVGGHLVSTLALVEAAETSRADIGEALRDALTDMRLMVDSLDEVEDDLNAVLAGFRVRIEPRLQAAGVSLRWQVNDLPRIPGLGPSRILHILRVLQEAVTNVIKHAQAQSIVLQAQACDGQARISLCDDGIGLQAARSGYGLINMRQRAQQGGFELAIDNIETGGCCVRLSLPIAAAEDASDPAVTSAGGAA